MLSINNLVVTSEHDSLVKGISLQIRPGEWLALAGESGSGKSLTAASIGGLLPRELQQSGVINWKGCDLSSLSQSQKRRLLGKEISYIFQDYQGAFTPFRTIGKQLDELLKTHTSMSHIHRRKSIITALDNVSLLGERIFRSYPYQLSGGQLQRAAIASAIILNPALIIADEPTTALDSLSTQKVLHFIAEAQKQWNIAVLWITHDLRHVQKYANRIAVMCKGEIVEQGEVNQVLNTPSHAYTQQLISAIPPLSSNAPRRLGQTEGALRLDT